VQFAPREERDADRIACGCRHSRCGFVVPCDFLLLAARQRWGASHAERLPSRRARERRHRFVRLLRVRRRRIGRDHDLRCASLHARLGRRRSHARVPAMRGIDDHDNLVGLRVVQRSPLRCARVRGPLSGVEISLRRDGELPDGKMPMRLRLPASLHPGLRLLRPRFPLGSGMPVLPAVLPRNRCQLPGRLAFVRETAPRMAPAVSAAHSSRS
jgi:hypothetical protein